MDSLQGKSRLSNTEFYAGIESYTLRIDPAALFNAQIRFWVVLRVIETWTQRADFGTLGCISH